MGIFTFKDDLKRVFTGSMIEVQALQLRLEDLQIKTIIKDRFSSGLMAGFGDSGQVQVFVDLKDYKKAYEIISNYISEINLRPI